MNNEANGIFRQSTINNYFFYFLFLLYLLTILNAFRYKRYKDGSYEDAN